MIFEAPQIFTARIDVLIDGTSVNGFPVDIDIFNESLDFSPVFWESDVDVSLSGKKRSNIRGYDLLLRLDYEHTLEPDKFDAIYEQLPNAIRYDTEIRLYPDATDTERYYAVVPTSSTVQSVMYESTVKGTDKPTLEFENVELLDSVASYGSPSSAGGDADTLNGFTADDFLKSDANDTYESGNTLTFNGDVNLQGVVSVGNLGGTPFSIGGVRLFENGDEQKLGVNESPQFAGLAIGNAIGDPFTVGGIRIFDAGDEQELGTSASPTFGGATFNGNFTAPDYNPSAWDDASDRSPTLLSVNASGVLTLTRFNTANLQSDLQAWADTRYALDSALDPNWDTAYDRSVIGFDLVTNSLEIDRQNASTLSVNLGTWGAGLYFQKALNLSEGTPSTMRNNLELGSSDSPTFAGVTLTGALSGTSASLSSELEISRTNGQSFQMFIVSSWSEQYRFSGIEGQMRFQARESGGGARHDIISFGWDTNYVSFGGDLRSGATTVIDSSRNASFVGGTFTGAINGTSATFTNTLTTSTIENSSAVKIRGNFKGYGDSNAFPNTHMDARLRDGDDNAVWHKYLRNSTDDAYNPYYERWFNGSAYRSIGINAALNFYVGTRFEATGFLISGTTVINSSRHAFFTGGTFTGELNFNMPIDVPAYKFTGGAVNFGDRAPVRWMRGRNSDTIVWEVVRGSFLEYSTGGSYSTSPPISINATAGVINISGNYRVNGTTVIDSSRNASFAGGTFTGNVNINQLTQITGNNEALRIIGSTNPYMSFWQSGTRQGFIQYHTSDSEFKIASEYGAINLLTGTAGGELSALYIDTSQRVGIGNKAPAFKFDVTGTGRFTGDVDILGNDGLDVRRGLTGGYNDTTDSGSNWGANIWGIGDAYTSSGHGSGFSLGNHYGLAWLRPAHPDRVGSSEGLYVYQVGNLLAHFGSERAYIREPLGIGVLSPSEQLDVNGNVQADDFILT